MTVVDSLVPVLIVTALVLLNGLFVAAEFAIVSAPRTAIDRRVAHGQRTARIVRQILHDPRRQDQYIATAQLGITFASLGLGMYGEHVLAGWLAGELEILGVSRWVAAHTAASVLAITVLTYFHIVVGEMVPKSLALQHSERTVLWVTPPILWIKAALYPLVVGLNGLGNGVLTLMGIRRTPASSEHYHTTEELQFIVKESQEGGLLRPESGRVLQELFTFGDLTAGEVMVPRVRITGIPVGATSGDVRTILRTSPHTRYPVYERDLDHVIGIMHAKSFLRRLLDGQAPETADLRPVAFVPETSTLDTVLAVMHRQRAQMIIVLDEHGGTAGLLTIEDLFEEIVGEIGEGQAEDPEIYEDAMGRLHVAGSVRVEEVGERLGRVLEHQDVDTVSGLILMLLGRPPKVGDTVVYDGVTFEVSAVSGRGVRECVVTPGRGGGVG